MKKICLLFLLSFAVSPGIFAQTYSTWVSRADSAYYKKHYNKSLEFFQKAFTLQKGTPGDLYNAGCVAALAGDTDRSFEILNAAVSRGWTNKDHIKVDTDLNSLHKDDRWKELLTRIKQKKDSVESNPLTKELELIYDKDQNVRKEIGNNQLSKAEQDSLFRELRAADSANLIRIREIIDEYGWLGPDEVGQKASKALFLVIQHADLEIQRQYIPLLRKAVSEGKAQAADLALMEDRIAFREGRKQAYGSQVGSDPETGEQYIFPLEDPDHVDERRSRMGLSPMAEYLEHFGLEWNVEDYKKNLPKYEKWHKQFLERIRQ